MLRRFDRCRSRLPLGPAGLAATMTAFAALLLAGPASAQVGGSWTSAQAIPVASGYAASATLADGDVLVAGGYGADGNPVATTAIYDPSTQAWTSGPALTTPRADAAAVTLADGDVLIAGGVTGDGALTGLSSAEVYDPSAGTMTPVSNDMSALRANPAAVLLPDGDVLIAGGADGSGASDTADLYDPATNAFTPVTSVMSAGRDYPAAAVLSDGDVLIAGGADTAGADEATADVFDPASETFTPVANDMSAGRAGEGVAALSGDSAIVFGGVSGDSTTATSDLYDATTNLFTAGPAMPVAPALFGSTTLDDGDVLVAGGLVEQSGNASLTAASEEYDPATDSWTAVGALPTAVETDIVAALPDGEALEAGGAEATSSPTTVTPTGDAALFTPDATTTPGGGGSTGGAGNTGDPAPPAATPPAATPPATTPPATTPPPGTGGSSTQLTILPKVLDTPPTIRLTGLRTHLTRTGLLRGLHFGVKPSKAASLQIRLVSLGVHAASGGTVGAALASRSYRLSAAGRTVTLVPNRRRMARRPGRVELIIVATDRAGGRRTVTRTITIRG